MAVIHGRVMRHCSSAFCAAASIRFRRSRGQLALLVDGLEDGLLTPFELAEILMPFQEAAQLDLIHPACLLLPVARDERHRAALVQQLERVIDLPLRKG